MQPVNEGFHRKPNLMHTNGSDGAKHTIELPSDRQIEVLRLVAEGLPYAQVGKKLRISERTVRTHLANIFACLGVRNRQGAISEARKLGLIPLHPEPATAEAALKLAQHYIDLAQRLMERH
jgi:DNA-binding CsgD family transcriptional regulator